MQNAEFLRWLDWIFLGEYLPSLSINYVAMRKDMGKTLPQHVLYKDENFLWSGFYCNRSRHGNVTTALRFIFIFVFLCTKSFFLKKSLERVCTCQNCNKPVIKLHIPDTSSESNGEFFEFIVWPLRIGSHFYTYITVAL